MTYYQQQQKKQMRQQERERKEQQNQQDPQHAQRQKQQPEEHTNKPPNHQPDPTSNALQELTRRQCNEWQWRSYCNYVQQRVQQQVQEYQNQQWQHYLQEEQRSRHPQQHESFAAFAPHASVGLSKGTVLPNFSASPALVIPLPDLQSWVIEDPATFLACLALEAPSPATRPGLKRPRSPSPPRDRPEPLVQRRSRRQLVPYLASGHLSPSRSNDRIRPISPSLQAHDAVIEPPSSPVARSARSEPLASLATIASGLPHGLPIPQSDFSSNNIAWPVLTEAEFSKLRRNQQQLLDSLPGQYHVRKSEE